jgi:hypothetical protein
MEAHRRMPALKLFVSHSSRLDEVPQGAGDKAANWRLLGEICDALEARYGDSIRILVDRDGLFPGDDWSRELNLWLAECQAAVILVSRRAMDQSHWVAKEAAILGWRKALDPEFTLIPVTIEGESQPSDLAQAFWGSLDMGRIQCLHAARSADEIVTGIAARFVKDRTLIRGCRRTPLDLLRDAIAHMLVGSQSPNALDAALDALDPQDEEPPDAGLPHPKQCGHRLARRLLRSSVDDIWGCFQVFRHLLRYAAPPIPVEQAKWLLGLVRALWVNPGAAAFLPGPAAGRPALALCGDYVSVPGAEHGQHRLHLRALPGSGLVLSGGTPPGGPPGARGYTRVGDRERMRAVARVLVGFQAKAEAQRVRPPGTAELLDAVGACEDLGIAVSTDPRSVWSHIERAVLAKDPTLRR